MNHHDWPALPRLQALVVDQMSKSLIPLLLSLVGGAPRLQMAELWDPERAWRPIKGDALISRLASLSQLESLGVSSCFLSVMHRTGFPALRTLSIEEEPEDITAGALMVRPFFRSTTSKLIIQNLRIPAAPLLIQVFLHQLLTSDDVPLRELGGRWSSLPEPIQPIPPIILSEILAAPRLLGISSPVTPNATCLRVPPYRPAQSGDQFLIRTYTPTRASTETLTHCRSQRSVYMHSPGSSTRLYRAERVCREHTAYRGQCVPANILSQVYTILGSSAAWHEPGRQLELPVKGWAVLREWHRSVMADTRE
jgi:hypothetical protein